MNENMNGYISFEKLWKLIDKKGLNKQYLINNGIHKATIYKLDRNETVTTETISKLCSILKCQPGQIMEQVEEQVQEKDIDAERKEKYGF
jgi:DNA-binding Xre family transcriptional regulator